MLDHEISFEKIKFGLLRKLSNVLGITFEELINTHPTLAPVFTEAGAVKSYTVSFASQPSAEIQKKIKKISPNGKVYLDFYVLNDILPIPEMRNSLMRQAYFTEKILLGIKL